MVFRDLLVRFLREILETFQVQLHHVTPNGIVTLSKFCWARNTFGEKVNIDCFCSHYELHNQPTFKDENGNDAFCSPLASKIGKQVITRDPSK